LRCRIATAAAIARENKRALHDVSEPVLGIDEMVAGVEVAVVLDRQRPPAPRRKYAQALGISAQDFERNIGNLHKRAADIVPHPLVEHAGEKLAELQWLTDQSDTLAFCAKTA